MAIDAASVKAVLQKDYDSSTDGAALATAQLASCLTSSGLMVARLVTAAAAKGVTLSSAEQDAIQNYLAAHLYSISDRPIKQKGTSAKYATFDGQTSMGLKATLYGQQAIALDPSGVLSNLDTPRRSIGMAWLGKPKSAQSDYSDRN